MRAKWEPSDCLTLLEGSSAQPRYVVVHYGVVRLTCRHVVCRFQRYILATGPSNNTVAKSCFVVASRARSLAHHLHVQEDAELLGRLVAGLPKKTELLARHSWANAPNKPKNSINCAVIVISVHDVGGADWIRSVSTILSKHTGPLG